MNKTWKDIPGYEGRYMARSDGQILSLERKEKARNAFGSMIRTRNRKVLKPILGSNGYFHVALLKEGVINQISVHRVIAITFIDNPLSKAQVNHKDGVKTNNDLSNLEWVTPSENGLHAYRELGIRPSAKGKYGKDSTRAVKVVQKNESGEIIKIWDAMMDAQRAGFDSGAICHCCKGQLNRHRGFIWEYFHE